MRTLQMIADSSLQENCNVEGFNKHLSTGFYKAFARLGFVANNAEDCLSCDSWIGFGWHHVGCNACKPVSSGL
jgi:hypothetical protein